MNQPHRPGHEIPGGPGLSVVVPVYNEEQGLPEFHSRLAAVLDGVELEAEVIYVDDGSGDATRTLLADLQRADGRVSVLRLSRNFGKEAALTAGLDHASGDATVVIDADLQDPPELIPEMVAQWRVGFDVVYGQRASRHQDPAVKRLTAALFYRLMQHVGAVRIPPDTGDFRLLSRRAVVAARELRERHRFMKGIFTWIGFRQCAVPFDRAARSAGTSKWPYSRLWNLSVEAITSFTTAPLRLAAYLGLATAGFAGVYGAVIIVKTLMFGDPVPGYPSLMVVILFLGGVQLLTLGIIGEYLGRIFNETKGRPLYLVEEFRTATDPARRVSPRAAAQTELLEEAEGASVATPGSVRRST